MVERIADDRVFRAQQRFEQTAIGVEGRAIEDGVLGAEEGRQPGLQRLVQVLRAADKAHRAQPEAMRAQRLVRGLDHPRVRRQAKVVVGAQVDDLAAVGGAHPRTLRRGDHALILEQPRRADAFEFGTDGCIECLGIRHGLAPVGVRGMC
ncbi:hypothetical protein D9M72_518420 [compost metagenome]